MAQLREESRIQIDSEVDARAAALINGALVCDAVVPWTQYGRSELRESTFPRYRECGFNFISLSLTSDRESPRDLLHALGQVRREVLGDPDLLLVGSASEIDKAQTENRLAISLNVQGTNNLGGDLNLVEPYLNLGIRQMLLVYNKKNMVGDGCHERTDSGLSGFGVELIQEMNRVGMIVDCSHCGLQTSLEAIDASTMPAVFSHSNAKAICDHDRNITDEQAKTCAESGGWIGLNGVGIFLGESEELVPQYFRHIDYMCELVGAEHVGLGTDFVYDADDMQRYMKSIKSPESGGYERMADFFQPEQLKQLVGLMINAGYTDPDIKGILGGNYRRVADRVWSCR